jgi:hypothetical protein
MLQQYPNDFSINGLIKCAPVDIAGEILSGYVLLYTDKNDPDFTATTLRHIIHVYSLHVDNNVGMFRDVSPDITVWEDNE